MLCNEIEGELVTVDVPGAPRVRLRAELLLTALGLDPTRTAVNLSALLLMAVLLLALVVALTWLQLHKQDIIGRAAQCSALVRCQRGLQRVKEESVQG